MEIKNSDYHIHSFIKILIQSTLNQPITLVEGPIGYAQ